MTATRPGGIPPGQARLCGKLLCFRKRYRFEVYLDARFFCLVHLSTKGAANKVEQPICTDESPYTIKVQISPLVRAYLWQIFAGLASRAIALKTLFERRARVRLKSNP